MAKYKYNWRLDQLSKPRRVNTKFVPKVVGLLTLKKKPPVKLSQECKYYADQMSRPKLRDLYVNKKLFGKLTKSGEKNFTNNINKAWDSIYNYYNKHKKEKQLRKLRAAQKKKPKKKPLDKEFYGKLATPKKVFEPEPKQKPDHIFSDFDRLDAMATPKPSLGDPPKDMTISKAALEYEPTENILRLARPSPRPVDTPLEPGAVKKSALKYKITPRIEVLAQPKKRSEESESIDFDPFAISKNALKYKPTARILELAKPVERD